MSESTPAERFTARLMEHRSVEQKEPMPPTMLRYAIEHLGNEERKQYMDMKRAVDRQ